MANNSKKYGITGRGLIWEIFNSWWIIFSFFALSWISFLIIGKKAKQKTWVYLGVLYFFLQFGIPFLFVTRMTDSSILIMIWLAAYVSGIVHSFVVRKKYLLCLDILHPLNAKSKENQKLRDSIIRDYQSRGIKTEESSLEPYLNSDTSEEFKSASVLDSEPSKLDEIEERLAATEKENLKLIEKVKMHDALLDEKTPALTRSEVERLHKYSAIIIFDTCSIMNFPNLLSGVQQGELVIVPKDVNNELENHKSKHYYDDRKIKAQRAITAIFNYKKTHPLIYADAAPDLIPETYRAESGELELTDNKILSVAIRYKKSTDIPIVFITDDRSLANKATGEGIQVWSAKDFLDSPDTPLPNSKTTLPSR